MADRPTGKTWSSSEIAERAGVDLQTIREMERHGLLREVRRRFGYREYTPEVVRVVAFVLRARELRLTWDEIRELLRLKYSPPDELGDARARMVALMETLRRQARGVRVLRHALRTLGRTLDLPQQRFPLLEALESNALAVRDSGDGDDED